MRFLILLSTLLVTIHFTAAATDKVICFYASWAIYRNGNGAFHPENIDANLCTHVYYTFLGVNADGTLKLLDPWNDVDLGGLSKVNNLKNINPDLKVLISIGGWNAGNAILTGICASSKLRANLIASSIEFFQTYGYDGLDIDWEYPYDSDKENFVTLLNEMRAEFDKNGYIISVTTSASPRSSYDIPAIAKVADLLNLMTYDFNVPGDGRTGLNSPLYGVQGEASINSSVTSWLEKGAIAAKMTISVPFYGHSYSLADSNNPGIGVPATTGIGGPYTQSPGTLGYHEVCEFYSDWEKVVDKTHGVPYIYNGNNWVSYDDPDSIGLKAKYAKEQGLAGVAVWSVDTDDFLGNCGIDHPLLHAIKDNIDA